MKIETERGKTNRLSKNGQTRLAHTAAFMQPKKINYSEHWKLKALYDYQNNNL